MEAQLVSLKDGLSTELMVVSTAKTCDTDK